MKLRLFGVAGVNKPPFAVLFPPATLLYVFEKRKERQ